MSLIIQSGVQLAPYTTFHIGGLAEYFCTVTDRETLRTAVAWARRVGVPFFVLGGGSNILVADEGIRGLVIHMQNEYIECTEETDDNVFLALGAGTSFDNVVAYTVDRGWWGLENLSSIPGTVGATPVQNVGAYGVEIAESIVCVTAYDTAEDTFTIFEKGRCAFGYRDSFFKTTIGKRYVIVEVTVQLTKTPGPKIGYKDLREYFGSVPDPSLRAIRNAVQDIRSKKFPDWGILGTAGSFFKNPTVSKAVFENLKEQYPELVGFPVGDAMVKVSLSWILDNILGCKGVREGNVGMYSEHALVMVNHAHATAKEIILFAQKIYDAVHAKTGIAIEWEVQYVK